MPRKATRRTRTGRIAYFKRLRVEAHGAAGSHTRAQVRTMFRKQRGKCKACGTSIRGRRRCHEDHIVPLSRGGSDFITNIQLLCPPCNYSKGNKLMSEWTGRCLSPR